VFAVAATIAVPVLAIASPAGAAGNNANAKTCQNNGWKTQLRADATGFKNQGDCVSYGAQGGAYAAECFQSTSSAIQDFSFIAPINTLNNVHVWNSFDGSCTNGFFTRSVVTANDHASAVAACAAIGAPTTSNQLSPVYAVPTNWWNCV
jgi:hypothetical protein